MNKYRVSIARLETKVYHFDIEAESEEAAKDATWSKYNNDYWGDGDCVHAEEWIQEIEEQAA